MLFVLVFWFVFQLILCWFYLSIRGDEFVFIVKGSDGKIRSENVRFVAGEAILMVAHRKGNSTLWDECSCFGEFLFCSTINCNFFHFYWCVS